MIVLFDIVPKKRRLFRRKPKLFFEQFHYNLKNLLGKKNNISYKSGHDITLWKITAEVKKNSAIDWETILYCLGTNALELILPAHIRFSALGEVPECVCEYRNDLIKDLLFELSSVEGIKFLKKSITKPRMFLIDRGGLFPELPLKYLPYVSEMTVFTENPARFAESKERALSEFGAVFTLTQSFAKLEESKIVIAPSGVGDFKTVLKNKIVFSGENTGKQQLDIAQCMVVDGFDLKLPRWLSEQAPEGYDAEIFVKALIEIAMKTEFGRKNFKKIVRPYEIVLTGFENEKSSPLECQRFSRKQITYQSIRRMLESLDIADSL